jgi:hypothetical protein
VNRARQRLTVSVLASPARLRPAGALRQHYLHDAFQEMVRPTTIFHFVEDPTACPGQNGARHRCVLDRREADADEDALRVG